MKKQNDNIENKKRKQTEKLLTLAPEGIIITPNDNDISKTLPELELQLQDLKDRNQALLAEKEMLTLACENYSAMIDFASPCLLSLSNEGFIIDLNAATAILLGKNHKELVGDKFEKYLSEETFATFKLFFAKIFNTKTRHTCEAIINTNEDEQKKMLIVGQLNSKGNLCLLNITDTTHQIDYENKVNQLSEFEDRLIDSLQDGFAIINTEGIQTLVNSSFCKMTGFSKEEMIGIKPPYPYWPKEEYGKIFAAFQGPLRENIYRFDLIFCRKNGERFPVIVSSVPIKNEQGQIISYAGTIADISDLKKTERALKENEERYRLLVENAPEALVVIDMDTQKFVSASKSAAELFKMSKKQLFEIGLNEISPKFQLDGRLSVDVAKEKINEAINGGTPFFEWMHKNSEGLLIPCEVKLVRLTFENKLLIRGSIHDISERKNRERLLRVQFTTAQVFSQSETIEECATRICNSIVKNLEWDFASLWLYDEIDQQLHFSDCWYASTPRINNFGAASREYTFVKGIGLPGQILESGKPLWVKDIQSQPNFPRAKHAMNAGLHAAFAFPIQSNEKIVGVLEVFSMEVKPPDDAMLTMFDAVGKLICQFILRKRAEVEIKKSNQRYEGLLSNIGAGIVVHDPATAIISCNPKGLELLGLTEDQIKGKTAFDPDWKFLDEKGDPLPIEKYPVNQIIGSKKAISNFIAGVNRPVTHDLIWVRVNGFPVLDIDGELIEIVISFIDVTESRLAEQELKKSESFLKETQQIAHLGVYTLDVESGTWDASEILEDILGIDANYEKTYEGGQEIIHPQWRKMVADYFTTEVIGNREKFDLQYRIIRPNDKAERWVHCVGDLKWSDDNKPLKLVATVQDITVIKQSEMLLKQKNEELEIAKAKAEESDRLKSAFLANMSHEIRTPMSGILGFADLLKTPGLSGDQQQNYIRIIEKSGARMLNIINDIIDISKIESHLMEVNIQQININEQIEYVYHFFKPEVEAKGLKLYLLNSLATNDSIIKTDKEKFFAILTNLVKNAVKFTNTGSIEIGYIIKSNDAKEELQFYVKDTGIGIPKERQGAIFERFVQANTNNKMALQGAGLGLSIAKGYVEMLQGKIWAESEVGKGSTFYFTLPYNIEPKKPTEQNILPAEKTYNRISNLKILLAEDDEIAEMLFDLSAKPFFKNIIKARNGIEAVETCRNNPDIDIVLMDVQMPLMDGHEATRQIREFNKDVVIIAQTAFGLAGDREKAINAGCNTYIAKPFRIVELLELIHNYYKK